MFHTTLTGKIDAFEAVDGGRARAGPVLVGGGALCVGARDALRVRRDAAGAGEVLSGFARRVQRASQATYAGAHGAIVVVRKPPRCCIAAETILTDRALRQARAAPIGATRTRIANLFERQKHRNRQRPPCVCVCQRG